MNPLMLLLFLIYIYKTAAETKHCVNCSYFIPHRNNKITDLGTCKLFGNKITGQKNADIIIYNFADHCRKDEYLCGKQGILYEPNVNIIKTNEVRAKEKKFYYYRILKIIKDNW
jgi:hypothetical protein